MDHRHPRLLLLQVITTLQQMDGAVTKREILQPNPENGSARHNTNACINNPYVSSRTFSGSTWALGYDLGGVLYLLRQ